MDIEKLTPAERENLMLQLEAKNKAEREAKAAREAEYKNMSAHTVDTLMDTIMRASEALANSKRYVVDELTTLIDIKQDLYNVQDEQTSHTFMSSGGNFRIKIGYYTSDRWDETVGTGEALIRTSIRKLATDDKSSALVDAVISLLSKDKAGNLKVKSVYQLSTLAEKIDDDDFREGLRIIRESYRPERSKTFVRAEKRDEATGAWMNIPLGMTEA